MNLIKSTFLCLCFHLLTSTLVNAQSGANLLAGKDLTTLKVDALTDVEIEKIQAQLKSQVERKRVKEKTRQNKW